jgi:aminopeptidase YwaD
MERPLGTKGNNAIINFLCTAFNELNYKIIDLPFECTVWQSGNSFVEQKGNKKIIFSSPFSQELKGIYPIKYVSSLEELQNIKSCNGILVFTGKLSENAKMPNNFPFYFPEEDKKIYELLDKINPKGIIAITGQDQSSGLNPFPLFEDVNLKIPTAYVSSLENIVKADDVLIEINSKTFKEKSKQVIFRKEGLSKDIILLSAHMDTKYFTNGAMDNAAGIYTLYEIAKLIKNRNFNHTIEIVPFNGEEHPEVSGQLAYLEYLKKTVIQ